MEKAERVIERMKVGGVEPNQVTYGTLIKGYAEQGDIDNMVKKYEEMLARQLKPNQTIFTMMVQAFGRQQSFDRAIACFKDMVALGLTPDTRARNTLLALPMSSNEREEIFGFLDSLSQGE